MKCAPLAYGCSEEQVHNYQEQYTYPPYRLIIDSQGNGKYNVKVCWEESSHLMGLAAHLAWGHAPEAPEKPATKTPKTKKKKKPGTA